MICRMTLLVIALVGTAEFAFAQEVQLATVKEANPQRHLSKEVRVILELRFVIISDELIKRLPEQWKPKWPQLPGVGAFVVCDQQQTELLMMAANGDRASGIEPVLTLKLLNGEKRQVPPLKPMWPCQTCQATVADSQQTIQVCLTWAKAKDGTETIPVMNAEVPVGSNLLVHTHTLSERRTTSYWDQFVDLVFHRKPKPGMEYQRGFLLVTPRIASQEQDRQDIGGK